MIKQLDFLFMLFMFVCFAVSLVGVLVCEGVQQRPFLLICPVSVATFFYLAFRVELGNKFK